MSDPRIQFLIDNLQESLDVEVKNWLGGLGSNEEKSKFAKEIIALANNGGGYIFIGFGDKGAGHPGLTPLTSEKEAFTQDAIAAVVNSYITPAFQCSLGWYRRAGSQIKHPVISVPGGHRTPVFAKRSSPDGAEATERLQNNVVYVRRPGGQSEPPRSQDDWAKLLERLVKARQGDLLDAIREILNPLNTLAEPASTLLEWQDESLKAWQSRISALKPGDGRRLESGYWSFAFLVLLDNPPSLAEINDALRKGLSHLSGWPPFTYLHQTPMRPVAQGDVMEAWLANTHDQNQFIDHNGDNDFWRVSRSGKGFLLRPMQEDEPGYLSNRYPPPQGKSFDLTLPIYRMAELLKLVEAFGLKFADENARYDVLLRYYGMKDRTLQQHKWEYALRDGARCHSEMLESRLSGIISELSTNIEERVFALLTPVFEQFDFTKLPKVIVDNVVKEALTYR